LPPELLFYLFLTATLFLEIAPARPLHSKILEVLKHTLSPLPGTH